MELVGRQRALLTFPPRFSRVLYIGELGAGPTIISDPLILILKLFLAYSSTLCHTMRTSNEQFHVLTFLNIIFSSSCKISPQLSTVGWFNFLPRLPEGEWGWDSLEVLREANSLYSDSMLSFKFMLSVFALWGKPRWRLWEQTCHGTSRSYFVTLRMPFLPPRRSVIACICHLLTNPCELKFSPKGLRKPPVNSKHYVLLSSNKHRKSI